MQCTIVSAEKEIFSEAVSMVVATGSLGEIGITPGHSQLLTGIIPGPVKVVKENGEEEVFFLSGGFRAELAEAAARLQTLRKLRKK